MILPEIFLQLRDKAIERLEEDQKYDSFGYHIDVNDVWENIYNTTELLSYLSIHNTHAHKYSELCFHMKDHLQTIKKQLKVHSKALEDVSKIMNTAAKHEIHPNITPMPNYKYDLLEMGVDWLFLSKYTDEMQTVLDFGAGCGRQIVGAYNNIKNFKSYIGIDASLNGYITQNIFYGIFALQNNIEFYDLIDYEAINIKIDVNSILKKENAIIHFPAWEDYKNIDNKSIDLILACHVHNELSRSDFLRLMSLVDEKLSQNGIFYVRSELGIWGDSNYEDKVKFHAIDPVKYLSEKQISVLETAYLGGFMTTVFARNKSKHFKNKTNNQQNTSAKLFEKITRKANILIRGKDDPITFDQIIGKLGLPRDQFNISKIGALEFKTYRDVAFSCAARYVFDEIGRTLNYYNKVQFIDDSFDLGHQILNHYKKSNNLIEIIDIETIDTKIPLIINSVEYHKFESQLKNGEYKTRLQYTYPVVIFLPDNFNYETKDLINIA